MDERAKRELAIMVSTMMPQPQGGKLALTLMTDTMINLLESFHELAMFTHARVFPGKPELQRALSECLTLIAAGMNRLSPQSAVSDMAADMMVELGLPRPLLVEPEKSFMSAREDLGDTEKCTCVICAFKRQHGITVDSDQPITSASVEEVFVHPEPSARQ